MKKKNIDTKIVDIITIICTCFVVMRASTIPMTYDEAYTVSSYVDKTSLLSIGGIYETFLLYFRSLANNHLLNTVLIYLFQLFIGIRYNDFLIRVPNIACGIIYLFFCNKIYKNKKIGFLTFALLLLNPFQNQYFSLARGYGMSLFFNTISIFYFSEYTKSLYKRKDYLNIALIFCVLGEYSNSISILLMASFFIDIIIDFIKRKEYIYEANYFIIFLCVIANIFIIIFHFVVTRNGLPMYSTNSLNTFVFFFSNYGVVKYFIYFSFFLFTFISIKNKKKISFYFELFIVFVVITLFTLLIFKKGMPTGRELIPFYSLYSFAFGEMLTSLFKEINIDKQVKKGCICIITILLFYNYLSYIKINQITYEGNGADRLISKFNVYNQLSKNGDITILPENLSDSEYQVIKYYARKNKYYMEKER